ncbi:hypothetical protein PQO01_06115 [Lentisphaera marina]|uniref:LamG-like jellyroll fold domain-containing protein n=1 Tax=Lentisphaera marina TaxID=1111041 RepID=UPI002365C06B|nr:LamG-like jellyroll fold domain-containing protein [Lentisphaera marina]MDD7984522.1 hypothetical protein [Lentisphaera marina]
MKSNKFILCLIGLSTQIFAGQISSWKFDSSKKKLDDSNSRGHHIKMIGPAAKFGKKGFDARTKFAAEFSGVEDSMMLITAHEDFNTPSFSLLAHAKPVIKKDGKYRAIFYARERDGFALYMSPRGNWELWTKGGGMTWTKNQIAPVVENQWEQFLISYNADDVNPENLDQGRLQIWQNGELKVDTYTEYKAAKSKLSIGSSTVGTANFKGLIDNIEYWDSPLISFKSKSLSLPARLIEKEIQIAEIKLSSLNFGFDTEFKLSGPDASLCSIKSGKLVLNPGIDLTNLKKFELTVTASGGKIAQDCSIHFSAPVETATASIK